MNPSPEWSKLSPLNSSTTMPSAPAPMNGLRILSSKNTFDRTTYLVGVVLADDALAGGRVVGCADARQQQQPHVVQNVGAENDQVGGLLVLLARAST